MKLVSYLNTSRGNMSVSHFALYDPAENGDIFPQSSVEWLNNAHNGYYVKWPDDAISHFDIICRLIWGVIGVGR